MVETIRKAIQLLRETETQMKKGTLADAVPHSGGWSTVTRTYAPGHDFSSLYFEYRDGKGRGQVRLNGHPLASIVSLDLPQNRDDAHDPIDLERRISIGIDAPEERGADLVYLKEAQLQSLFKSANYDLRVRPGFGNPSPSQRSQTSSLAKTGPMTGDHWYNIYHNDKHVGILGFSIPTSKSKSWGTPYSLIAVEKHAEKLIQTFFGESAPQLPSPMDALPTRRSKRKVT